MQGNGYAGDQRAKKPKRDNTEINKHRKILVLVGLGGQGLVLLGQLEVWGHPVDLTHGGPDQEELGQQREGLVWQVMMPTETERRINVLASLLCQCLPRVGPPRSLEGMRTSEM